MLDAALCQKLANEYKAGARSSGLSVERTILLKNIARTLTGLANQSEATLTREETRQGRLRGSPSDTPGAN
ncbi:hypothetical protein FXV83_22185 [Bradyrhizobium hipponense]|uniref:Uncharacterized protein n=1 Tax=Bradyrhizobium hipponense TaxID=2605638 RepID=A0A5S4YVQ6_9BRAD|nr:hypothetical protein FXV83_22185 [Bradyrhizobium hipponense]